MDRKHTSIGKESSALAENWRIHRLIQGQDSVCSRRAYTFTVILTILLAVAMALIAPSIEMPDTVLREHHVSSHVAGVHGANIPINTIVATPVQSVDSGRISRISETLNPSISANLQSTVVLRC
jgi:hypothetical protein